MVIDKARKHLERLESGFGFSWERAPGALGDAAVIGVARVAAGPWRGAAGLGDANSLRQAEVGGALYGEVRRRDGGRARGPGLSPPRQRQSQVLAVQP